MLFVQRITLDGLTMSQTRSKISLKRASCVLCFFCVEQKRILNREEILEGHS